MQSDKYRNIGNDEARSLQRSLGVQKQYADTLSETKSVSDVASGHRVATACHLANLSLRLGRSLKRDCKSGYTDDAEADKQFVRPYRSPWDRELKALGVA